MAETIFTDANFAEEIKTGVSLVDFWAAWCGPCRSQGPIVDKIAGAYSGKAKIGKMNVDENQATPGKFGISGIPTLIIFKDGREANRFVGLQQERTITAALDALVGK
ncbi:MAG: thioredoxin [bacterium]